nr:hypothetical protein [Acidocella sp. C78]
MNERMVRVDAAGTALAGAYLPGEGKVVVFLPGFASDMQGTKALFLRDECAARGGRCCGWIIPGTGNRAGGSRRGRSGAGRRMPKP